jgi:hypothetical protein
MHTLKRASEAGMKNLRLTAGSRASGTAAPPVALRWALSLDYCRSDFELKEIPAGE